MSQPSSIRMQGLYHLQTIMGLRCEDVYLYYKIDDCWFMTYQLWDCLLCVSYRERRDSDDRDTKI